MILIFHLLEVLSLEDGAATLTEFSARLISEELILFNKFDFTKI